MGEEQEELIEIIPNQKISIQIFEKLNYQFQIKNLTLHRIAFKIFCSVPELMIIDTYAGIIEALDEQIIQFKLQYFQDQNLNMYLDECIYIIQYDLDQVDEDKLNDQSTFEDQIQYFEQIDPKQLSVSKLDLYMDTQYYSQFLQKEKIDEITQNGNKDEIQQNGSIIIVQQPLQEQYEFKNYQISSQLQNGIPRSQFENLLNFEKNTRASYQQNNNKALISFEKKIDLHQKLIIEQINGKNYFLTIGKIPNFFKVQLLKDTKYQQTLVLKLGVAYMSQIQSNQNFTRQSQYQNDQQLNQNDNLNQSMLDQIQNLVIDEDDCSDQNEDFNSTEKQLEKQENEQVKTKKDSKEDIRKLKIYKQSNDDLNYMIVSEEQLKQNQKEQLIEQFEQNSNLQPKIKQTDKNQKERNQTMYQRNNTTGNFVCADSTRTVSQKFETNKQQSVYQREQLESISQLKYMYNDDESSSSDDELSKQKFKSHTLTLNTIEDLCSKFEKFKKDNEEKSVEKFNELDINPNSNQQFTVVRFSQISNDGQFILIVNSEKMINIYDTKSSKLLKEFNQFRGKGQKNQIIFVYPFKKFDFLIFMSDSSCHIISCQQLKIVQSMVTKRNQIHSAATDQLTGLIAVGGINQSLLKRLGKQTKRRNIKLYHVSQDNFKLVSRTPLPKQDKTIKHLEFLNNVEQIDINENPNSDIKYKSRLCAILEGDFRQESNKLYLIDINLLKTNKVKTQIVLQANLTEVGIHQINQLFFSNFYQKLIILPPFKNSIFILDNEFGEDNINCNQMKLVMEGQQILKIAQSHHNKDHLFILLKKYFIIWNLKTKEVIRQSKFFSAQAVDLYLPKQNDIALIITEDMKFEIFLL